MEGVIVRRVIPFDDSSLFNAVGFVMELDKHKAPDLIQVISATLLSDPEKYSEDFLGKPNKEYCVWIMDSQNWGVGAPEEFEQTIFVVGQDRSIGPVEEHAMNLVMEAQSKRNFVDRANFALRCGVCQIGVVGKKEAVEHAQATGHVNFRSTDKNQTQWKQNNDAKCQNSPFPSSSTSPFHCSSTA